MKRLKNLLLIGLLACTVGCQKQGRELFSVELGEPDPAKVSETDPVEPVQNTEDKPEETTVEETISYSGEKDIDDYIYENLVLGDDEEIEYSEWVHGFNDYGTFFRVSIGYNEQPENEYKHKRDLFIFRTNEIISIMVDYHSKSEYDFVTILQYENRKLSYYKDIKEIKTKTIYEQATNHRQTTVMTKKCIAILSS